MADFASELSLLDAAMKTVTVQPKLPNAQNIMSASALLALDLPEPAWHIDHYIPKSSLTFIAGRPKTYKTFLALRMAYALSLGLPLFDSAPMTVPNPALPRTKVLFIEEEMNRNLLQHRLKLFTRVGHAPPADFIMYTSSGFKLSSDKDLKGLADYIKEHEIKIVFLDPFSSVGGFENENDNSEVSKVLDNVRRTLVDSDLGISVVCIHHPSKNDKGALVNLRGAGDIHGKADHIVVLERSEVTPQTQVTIMDSRLVDKTKEPVLMVEFRSFDSASLLDGTMATTKKMDILPTVSQPTESLKK